MDASELAQPSDIAAAVAYLASGDATMVQGAGLIVDGGRLSEL
ncbi:SDR family oxidoreductase [Ramlibacter sp.]|nr:SDR family oxidoreductase [Ramlibacter sp.]